MSLRTDILEAARALEPTAAAAAFANALEGLFLGPEFTVTGQLSDHTSLPTVDGRMGFSLRGDGRVYEVVEVLAAGVYHDVFPGAVGALKSAPATFTLREIRFGARGSETTPDVQLVSWRQP